MELVRRKIPVVLRSQTHPLHPSVCSQGAGGLWMPFHCDDPRTDRWSIETLDELYPMGEDPNNDFVESKILFLCRTTGLLLLFLTIMLFVFSSLFIATGQMYTQSASSLTTVDPFQQTFCPKIIKVELGAQAHYQLGPQTHG